jgi:hypothetical protein
VVPHTERPLRDRPRLGLLLVLLPFGLVALVLLVDHGRHGFPASTLMAAALNLVSIGSLPSAASGVFLLAGRPPARRARALCVFVAIGVWGVLSMLTWTVAALLLPHF